RPTRSQSGAPVELSPVPELGPKVDILEGNWKTEADTRNAGLDCLDDCGYTFVVDSDEILLDRDLEELVRLCRSGEHDVISVRLYTYWKNSGYRIDPPEDGSIKLVLRKGVRIQGVREVQGAAHPTDIRCRHLSYVRTDEELREKLRLSGHSREFLPEWYERVWRAWDLNPGLENLHPVHPKAYRRAVAVEDTELQEVLEAWGCPA